MKITKKEKMITRQKLENPFSQDTYNERIVKSKAIDLLNNSIFEELENGYSKVTPINKKKLVEMK